MKIHPISVFAAVIAISLIGGGRAYDAVRPRIILVSASLSAGRTFPPAPDGYSLRIGKPGADQSLSVIEGIALRIDEEVVTDRADIPDPTAYRLISRDWLVPVADETGRITGKKPLSTLADGEWAEPLDGMRVDDPRYPDILFSYARCDYSGRRAKAELESWLSAAFPEPDAARVAYIGAVGDLMPGRGAERTLRAAPTTQGNPVGVEGVFTDTLGILRSADVMIGNLEGAVTSGGAQAAKSYTFKYKPDILAYLKDAGFDYIMLTNNHSFDFGLAGFTDTLKAMRASGLATSGCGNDLEEASAFWRTQVGSQRISVISCGAYPVEQTGFDGKKTAAAGPAKAGILWESEAVASLVRKEKETGSFVVVNVHGGQEYRTEPSERQRAFYRSLCDAGADAVFGSHPHVLQPAETRGGSVIFYSLGNFLFPGMQGMKGAEDSVIVRLGVMKGKIVYRETFPARLSGTTVRLAPDDGAR